ncbi:TPA: hypothetical protein ACFP4Y_001786, partial [Neisseria bacilliformis]
MADKRLDSLNEYEQIKRKNRRRLVGASAMVAAAGIVFGLTVNGGADDTPPPAVKTEIPAQRPSENPASAASEYAANQDEDAADTYDISAETASDT